jgi:hypothetical protein
VVIQELLKEIAQTQQVDLNAKQRFKGAHLLALLIDVFSLTLFLFKYIPPAITALLIQY